MRLDKYLSEAGLSRSRAREAIAAGRVRVDGAVVRASAQQVPPGARVTLDGAQVSPRGEIYLMMHKPRGVITAREDRASRTVFDLLPEAYRLKDLCAVGRLDKDTTGLLLLTTDGQLAHRLISPRFTVGKTYLARVEGTLAERHVAAMARGVALSDFTARGAMLEIVEPDLGRLKVTEGKYHQVKRMFGALGCPVISLHREAIGGVALDPALAPGEVRELTPGEVKALKQITRMEEA